MAESCIVEVESKYVMDEENSLSDDCEVSVANLHRVGENELYRSVINEEKSSVAEDEIQNEIVSDDEYNYSDDSACFEDSCGNSEITNVTPRSPSSTDTQSKRKISRKSPNRFFEGIDGDNEINFPRQLPDNIRDNIRRMCSSASDNRNVARLDSINLRPSRKNMSFTNAEMRRIEVENQYLLKKIMAHQKPQNKVIKTQLSQPKVVSSSAINRRKLQKKIEEENMMLLRRIQEAKSCAVSGNVTPGYRVTAL